MVAMWAVFIWAGVVCALWVSLSALLCDAVPFATASCDGVGNWRHVVLETVHAIGVWVGGPGAS
jgi:hypothetical protein